MFNLYHTSCKLSSDYHSETIRQSEHTNQTVEQYFVVLSTINKMMGLIYYIWLNLLTITQKILLLDIPHFLRTLGTILVGRCLNILKSQHSRLLKIGSPDSKKFKISFRTIYVMLRTLK